MKRMTMGMLAVVVLASAAVAQTPSIESMKMQDFGPVDVFEGVRSAPAVPSVTGVPVAPPPVKADGKMAAAAFAGANRVVDVGTLLGVWRLVGSSSKDLPAVLDIRRGSEFFTGQAKLLAGDKFISIDERGAHIDRYTCRLLTSAKMICAYHVDASGSGMFARLEENEWAAYERVRMQPSERQ
ncbi:MAG: hypothetical protein KGL53_14855 [Elusimicrobia bacterium]|nr:hypothetical protein [Elusimicrobiota bacterium]